MISCGGRHCTVSPPNLWAWCPCLPRLSTGGAPETIWISWGVNSHVTNCNNQYENTWLSSDRLTVYMYTYNQVQFHEYLISFCFRNASVAAAISRFNAKKRRMIPDLPCVDIPIKFSKVVRDETISSELVSRAERAVVRDNGKSSCTATVLASAPCKSWYLYVYFNHRC